MSGTYNPDAVQSPAPAAAVFWRGSGLLQHPLPVALLIVAVVTALRAFGTVDSDVSWQLWIAERVHAGARLYRDIVEVNPPLWFWLALPVERAATLLHVRVDAVLIAAMSALAALSLAATDRLLPNLSRPCRSLFLGYAALVLTAMPWMQVGQREQIALIGALPYAMLIAARHDGRAISRRLAAMVGAGAAVGFALKHYFLFVPLSLELWLLIAQRKCWRPLRPEIVAMVAVGAAYAAAILLWAREYLTSILPLVRLAYGVTGAPHLTDLLQPAVAVGLIILLLVTAARPRLKPASAAATALLVAATGFLIAYFVQAKGWAYHALPLLGCSSIGLAALLVSTSRPPALLTVSAPALFLAPFAIAAQGALREPLPSPDLRNAVLGLGPGDSVGFIATDPALAWSITLQRRLRYASRYMGFWMMRAVVENEQLGGPDPRLAKLGRTVVAQTVADFRCTPPRRIIVARPRPGEEGFDIFPFFTRNRDFSALLTHYKRVERTSLDVYEIVSPVPPARPGSCRPGI